MGHAVYSVSDPRAEIFKRFVKQLAVEKGHEAEYALYEKVEHMAPEIIGEKRKMYKGVNANVDFTAAWSTVCWIFLRHYIRRSLQRHVS